MTAKTNTPHNHGDRRLHQRFFGSSGYAAVGFVVRVVSGSATWESCQFRGVTSSASREHRLCARRGVNSWLERGIMLTGPRLAFLLVWSRLGVEGPSYEAPGFNGGQPAPTAPCPACRGRSQLESENHYRDRKSTRLNSSHLGISYAVFCLKK